MELEKYLKKENEAKDYIIYDVVVWAYHIVSKRKMERVKSEFGNSTTLWRVYPYSDELWGKLNKPIRLNLLGYIIKKFINKF